MIWKTVYYTWKRELRDYVSMLLMVLFPIVLACIVGNALKSDFQSPGLNLETVAFVLEKEDSYLLDLQKVFQTDSVKEIITVTQVSDLEQAKRQMKQKTISGYITYNSSEKKLNLVMQDINSQGAQIAASIMNQYIESNAMFETVSYEKVEELSDYVGGEYVSNTSMIAGHKPQAFDYYGITLMVLVCMFGSLYSVKIISETLEGKHGERIRSITTHPSQIYIGVYLASLVMVCAQILILLLFYKNVYGVYLGTNYGKLFVIIFSFIVFTNLFGVALITVLRKYNVAYTIANILILGTTFLSSGFVILDLGDGVLGTIVERVLPNAICQNALFSVIYGTGSELYRHYLIGIGCWSVVLLVLTWICRRVYEYRH
ncbi:ABC transporter permease [Anaerosporobacter faecicola]|uniref:ABC transporter permease n=1 Tax=Anaerosporobacter faecicola TaxID=2718714 RepID=UPI00143C5D99|nr:ABC transporter permease [Anaerosporobacter faecicola]